MRISWNDLQEKCLYQNHMPKTTLFVVFSFGRRKLKSQNLVFNPYDTGRQYNLYWGIRMPLKYYVPQHVLYYNAL